MLLRRPIVVVDSAVSRLDKIDRQLAVSLTLVQGFWNSRGGEIRERCEEANSVIVIRHQVLQQKEVHRPAEVTGQLEELGLPRQRFTEGVALPTVVTSDAHERQIEEVPDGGPVRSPCLVERLFAVDLVAWEDHHAPHGVTDPGEVLQLSLRDVRKVRRRNLPVVERRNHRIARKGKLTEFRLVVQVDPRAGVAQIELLATG